MEFKKHIRNQANGLNYTLVGNYYIPDLKVEDEDTEQYPLGKYGRMRRAYLKEHRPVVYEALVLDGMLLNHLRDIDRAARSRMTRIMRQMRAAEGVTEELKIHDQMAWVRAMNSIQSRAEEIVLSELIFN